MDQNNDVILNDLHGGNFMHCNLSSFYRIKIINIMIVSKYLYFILSIIFSTMYLLK